MKNIVEMRNITIEYRMKKYDIKAVSNCDFDIKKGCMTAIVGESGSGKTTLASSIIRCISSPGELVTGSISLFSNDQVTRIDKATDKEMEKIRWEKISMVFQAAQSSFNPIMTIWEHFKETYHFHFPKENKETVIKHTKRLLDYVKLDADRVLNAYPHELSGGMKQRVSIAFALLFNPDLIILDEPTTALDVITQRYIFEILKDINKKLGISMLLMTHDINVVAEFSDYVGIMYAGRIMEFGPTNEIFSHPHHPYTQGLLNATPSLSGDINNLKPIKGIPPNLRDLPKGCVFSDRCDFISEKCIRLQEPKNIDLQNSKCIKCFLCEVNK